MVLSKEENKIAGWVGGWVCIGISTISICFVGGFFSVRSTPTSSHLISFVCFFSVVRRIMKDCFFFLLLSSKYDIS